MISAQKTLMIVLIFVLAASSLSLLIVKPASSQITSTPSVPTFTVQLVGPSYNAPPTYSINQSTGMIEQQLGYHSEYSAVNITITNQPFAPTAANQFIPKMSLYYNVQVKEQNEDNWVDIYSPANYPSQSNSNYTTIYIFIGNQNEGLIHAGTQTDIQVQAMIGYTTAGLPPNPFTVQFVGQSSGWSPTQTVTIPADIPLSPTPTPSFLSGNQPITTLTLAVIAFLLAVIIFLLLYRRHRKTANLKQ